MTAHRTWTENEIHQLGTAHDAVLADRFRCTVASVRNQRKLHGVSEYAPPSAPVLPVPPNGDQSFVYPSQRRYTVWPADVLSLLGIATDRSIATAMRCSVHTVRRKRAELGIEAVYDKAQKKLSDEDILATADMPALQSAALLGISPQTVIRKRKRNENSNRIMMDLTPEQQQRLRDARLEESSHECAAGEVPVVIALPEKIGVLVLNDATQRKCTVQTIIMEIVASHYRSIGQVVDR